ILRQRRSTAGAASVAVGRERAVAAKTRSRGGTRNPRPADMPSAEMRATETGAAARAGTAETCSPEVAAAAAETGTATEVTATTTEVTAATAKVTAATAKVTAAS